MEALHVKTDDVKKLYDAVKSKSMESIINIFKTIQNSTSQNSTSLNLRKIDFQLSGRHGIPVTNMCSEYTIKLNANALHEHKIDLRNLPLFIHNGSLWFMCLLLDIESNMLHLIVFNTEFNILDKVDLLFDITNCKKIGNFEQHCTNDGLIREWCLSCFGDPYYSIAAMRFNTHKHLERLEHFKSISFNDLIHNFRICDVEMLYNICNPRLIEKEKLTAKLQEIEIQASEIRKRLKELS
jgi:hypothetical protein